MCECRQLCLQNGHDLVQVKPPAHLRLQDIFCLASYFHPVIKRSRQHAAVPTNQQGSIRFSHVLIESLTSGNDKMVH